MRRTLTSVIVAAALVTGACGSDSADGPEDTTASSIGAAPASATADSALSTDGAPPPSGADAASESPTSPVDTAPPAGESSDGGDPDFTASLDDPVYVDLVLDCVYGENEGGSCEQLAGAGLDPDDAYGLGNSLTQAPNDVMRDDCIAGGIGCAELNARVRTAIAAGDTTTLLCFFHGNLTGAAPDDIDAFYEGELLGPDAPVGVADALFDLVEDPSNAELIATVDGYVAPICG